jgi:ATP-binding protein involved in chromosome partitioning
VEVEVNNSISGLLHILNFCKTFDCPFARKNKRRTVMSLNMYKEPTGPFPGVKHVIGVAAGKGGVGKSTVTVNLALQLKERGLRVGIMDSDLYGPSLQTILPEDRLPGKNEDKLLPALSWGISLMSMAYFRKDDEAAIVRAPIANQVIGQFIDQVDWGELDYLLIDFPPGTGDIPLTVSQKARLEGVILVTTPQKVAVLDVRKAKRLFDQVGVKVLGVVENMSPYFDEASGVEIAPFGKGGGTELATEWNLPLMACVPLDPALCAACDDGRPMHKSRATSPAIKAFTEMAEELTLLCDTCATEVDK